MDEKQKDTEERAAEAAKKKDDGGGGTERRNEREVALAPALPCAGDNRELP
jgi:hypothetical protein